MACSPINKITIQYNYSPYAIVVIICYHIIKLYNNIILLHNIIVLYQYIILLYNTTILLPRAHGLGYLTCKVTGTYS